jgi:hypothetical protein
MLKRKPISDDDGGRFFLRRGDVSAKGLALEILSIEHLPGKEDALRFAGEAKRLRLRPTVAESLRFYFGAQANWIGQTILVYIDSEVCFEGQQVGGIRVRKAARATQAS